MLCTIEFPFGGCQCSMPNLSPSLSPSHTIHSHYPISVTQSIKRKKKIVSNKEKNEENKIVSNKEKNTEVFSVDG
jgi:hypothetical protein